MIFLGVGKFKRIIIFVKKKIIKINKKIINFRIPYFDFQKGQVYSPLL